MGMFDWYRPAGVLRCPLDDHPLDQWQGKREFILVDLRSQMPYLPRFARGWPHERLLAWLRVWGEVRKRESKILATSGGDTYDFLSWAGLWTTFVLMPDGRMFIPCTSIRAWPEHEDRRS